MSYLVGQRVIINLDIDNYNIGDDVLFGTVIDEKSFSSKRPSYIQTKSYTQVKGDDDKIYETFTMGNSIQTPNSFFGITQFQIAYKNKIFECLALNECYNAFSDLFVELLKRRSLLGLNTEQIKKIYIDDISEKINSNQKTLNNITFLSKYEKAFSNRNYINVIKRAIEKELENKEKKNE